MEFPDNPIYAQLLDINEEDVDFNLGESTCPVITLTDLLPDKESISHLMKIPLDYGSSRGLEDLRKAIAHDTNVTCQESSVRKDISPENVLITVGAASSLFIIAFSVVKKGEDALIVSPNYPTSIDVLKGLGANIKFLGLDFDKGFELDVKTLEKMVDSNTKLVSITSPHNPSAREITPDKLIEISEAVRSKSPEAVIIVDETYRYSRYSCSPIPPPTAASLCDNIVTTTSMSKGMGAPGARLGWLITRNVPLMNKLIKAKQNIWVCNGTLDEYIGLQVIKKRKEISEKVQTTLDAALKVLKEWIQKEEEYVEWIVPMAGALATVRLKESIPDDKVSVFYDILLKKYKTLVAQGEWFYAPKRTFRIGFGYPKLDDLIKGLEGASKALRDVAK